ncbi:MAG TPA: plastocyanin/azurin family copper-binding protein [Solirubrobacterales bacterium]|nr:plastocyanin/azurin family copper-binding protein [Solirubrobacterales bacterium]
MSGRAISVASAVLAALALSGASAAAAEAPARVKVSQVTINDFYFSPTAVNIRKGQAVRWVWSSTNTYPHDVHLKKGPANLKKKASYSTRTSAVTEAHFQKSFETAGTYKFICTIHPTEMRMTVTVRK